MTDKKTKIFFKFLAKQNKLFSKLPIDKSFTTDDQRKISLYLTEIYFRSQHLVNLIKNISETNLKFTENDLDSLLGDLIDLRIEIYDEIVDWIKELKKHLNIAINKVGDLGAEKYGWD